MPIRIVPIKATQPIMDTPKLLAALTRALVDTQAEGVRLMATYPPQRAGSRYRRTGTLKRSWSMPPVKREGTSMAAEIFSNGGIAPYNDEVEGHVQSQFFAQRGWVNVRELVKLVNKQLPVRVQRAIDKATGTKGGVV